MYTRCSDMSTTGWCMVSPPAVGPGSEACWPSIQCRDTKAGRPGSQRSQITRWPPGLNPGSPTDAKNRPEP